MRAVEDDGTEWTTRAVTTGRPMDAYPARKLMDAIAEGTWLCGDPGLQYEDTIQRWQMFLKPPFDSVPHLMRPVRPTPFTSAANFL